MFVLAGAEKTVLQCCINDSDQNRLCNTEERFFLLQQAQTFSSEPFSLPGNHAFYRYSGTGQKNRLLFQMAGFNEIQVLIAVPAEKSLFLPLTVSLLKEKLHDWQWRIQAGEQIERQQKKNKGMEPKI